MRVGGIENTIIAASVNLAQRSNMGDIGTAVLGEALDSQETAGAGLIKMIDAAAMERSVNPNVGGNFDISV
ncbi:MAG: YjfB family protein [Lachnospiraceae bacterium]|nr:YjfB family protein [Lachnospiraceae bacterium]